MKRETADALKSLFDGYDKRRAEDQKQQKKSATERDVFLQRFDKVVAQTIRPAMEELSGIIKSRGHGCEITQEAETRDLEGRTKPARVRLEIYPNEQQRPYGYAGEFPTLTFSAETHGDKIWTHISTMMPARGGTSGRHNEYSLETITRDAVEGEVVNFVDRVFER